MARKLFSSNAYSVSLAAAEKTLEVLATTSALGHIADYGSRLP